MKEKEISSSIQQKAVTANEAVAWAALACGLDYFSHYPGSPVNTIEPFLKQLTHTFNQPVHFNDALNEHIAVLSAAGASLCGARSLVVMKHVGMNIAADPLNYLGYCGIRGGMVIVVGTDPGANSSTGEEDPHWYLPQINFPLFEPTNVQEVYQQIGLAFEMSESQGIPVVLFMPVRLCHNVSLLSLPAQFNRSLKTFYFEKNRDKMINVGQRAVRNHKALVHKIKALSMEQNFVQWFGDATATDGIITRGITLASTLEVLHDLNRLSSVSLLNVDLVYPIPKQALHQFFQNKKRVVIIEDQDGFLEYMIKMHLFNDINCSVIGKSHFPEYGEIRYSMIDVFLRDWLGVPLKFEQKLEIGSLSVPERLGTFCPGCPHRGSYFAIDKALASIDGIIGGDIGCSSLPPFRADWLLCMNAGIGISQGMSQVLTNQKIVSTGGEGSFFHGGLISLQSAIENKINLLHLVFDNRAMAMTGHQNSPTTLDADRYQNATSNLKHFNWRTLLESIGVNRYHEANAFDPIELAQMIQQELGKDGVSVIWVTGDCALQPSAERLQRRKERTLEIDNDKCGSCSLCYDDLQCPAIQQIAPLSMEVDKNQKLALTIDLDQCARCGACLAICPNNAIQVHNNFVETV